MQLAKLINESYLLVSEIGFKEAIKELSNLQDTEIDLNEFFKRVTSQDDFFEFRALLSFHLSDKLQHLHNDIYLQAVNELLSIKNKESKELFISDTYLVLSLYYLDIKNLILNIANSFVGTPYNPYIEQDSLDTIEDDDEFNELITREYAFGEMSTIKIFQIHFLQMAYNSFGRFLFAFKQRFGQYINESTLQKVDSLKGERRIVQLGFKFLTEPDELKSSVPLSKIEWKADINDFKDLVVGLVKTHCIALTDEKNTEEIIGTYLFHLFNVKPEMHHKQYGSTVGDIHKRAREDCFILKMKEAHEAFINKRSSGTKSN